MKDINVLAIETSCDETSCAIVGNGRHILSNIVWSQADIFKKYGGVVPEIASRKHIEYIIPAVDAAFKESGITPGEIHAVAATYGPGLIGALLVGLSAAKGLSYAYGKPFVGVNHLEGHIAANYISHVDLKPPFVCLLVSGGHSHILFVRDYTSIEVLGRTRDDAAGEAYDKVARSLGLGYPGGPLVDMLAGQGNPEAIKFPRTRFKDNPFDFSFSGLKTAVLSHINSEKQAGRNINAADVCASFQKNVVDTLTEGTAEAARITGSETVVLAGGVAANSGLRERMGIMCRERGISLKFPPPGLCTDNAAMIASAAYFSYMNGKTDDYSLNAASSLKL
jgi:N6-L-threonylcarbamoyladenine synthase